METGVPVTESQLLGVSAKQLAPGQLLKSPRGILAASGNTADGVKVFARPLVTHFQFAAILLLWLFPIGARVHLLHAFTTDSSSCCIFLDWQNLQVTCYIVSPATCMGRRKLVFKLKPVSVLFSLIFMVHRKLCFFLKIAFQ